MIARLAAGACAFLFALVLTAGAAPPAHSLRETLAAGHPAVVIVAPKPSAADLHTEAYADWSGYLNDFAGEHTQDFAFFRVTPARLKTLLVPASPIKGAYATIFIRDPSHAIVHDGMVLDSILYRQATSFLTNADKTADESSGLAPFSFELAPSKAAATSPSAKY